MQFLGNLFLGESHGFTQILQSHEFGVQVLKAALNRTLFFLRESANKFVQCFSYRSSSFFLLQPIGKALIRLLYKLLVETLLIDPGL